MEDLSNFSLTDFIISSNAPFIFNEDIKLFISNFFVCTISITSSAFLISSSLVLLDKISIKVSSVVLSPNVLRLDSISDTSLCIVTKEAPLENFLSSVFILVSKSCTIFITNLTSVILDFFCNASLDIPKFSKYNIASLYVLSISSPYFSITAISSFVIFAKVFL